MNRFNAIDLYKLDGIFCYIPSLVNPLINIAICIVVVKFLKKRKLNPF